MRHRQSLILNYLLLTEVINQKGHAENFIKEFLFFLVFWFLFALIGIAVTMLLEKFLAVGSLSDLAKALTTESEPAARNAVRYYLIMSHSFMFALPSLAYAIWWNRGKTLTELKLNNAPHPKNLLYSGLTILTAFPFVVFTMWLNQQIPISEAMLKMEESANEMAQNLLVMETPYEFILTIITVGATAAIGEELLFRGILQPMFEKLFRNGHLAVWVTAILFSAIHFQMQGFIPRVLLGAFLGYAFLWSRNLWVPIFAHFIFNSSQVVLKYGTSVEVEGTEVEFNEIVFPALLSLLLVAVIGNWFRRFNLQEQAAGIDEAPNKNHTVHE